MSRLAKKIVRFGEKYREAILSGEKRVTVRKGEVNWADDLTLRIGKDELVARKTSQEAAALQDLSAEVVIADGCEDHAELLEVLRKLYPELTAEDTVTALWFEVAELAPAEVPEERDQPLPDRPVTEVMDFVLSVKNGVISGLAKIKAGLAELDHVIQRDPRFEDRSGVIFDAISSAHEEAKTVAGKVGQLTKLLADVNGYIEDVRRAELKEIAGHREVMCCVCGLVSAAAVVVGESAPKGAAYKGDPFRANEGICPACGMAGLRWADISPVEAVPSGEPSPPGTEASVPDESKESATASPVAEAS
jgi:hypothetical protein